MRILRVLDKELKVKISPSWLDKAACPAALNYEYIEKLEREFSIPGERGSAAHAAIADLTDICIKEGIQPKELEHELVMKAVSDNTDHRLFDELPNIMEWVIKWSERYRLSKHIVGHEERMAIDELYRRSTGAMPTSGGSSTSSRSREPTASSRTTRASRTS